MPFRSWCPTCVAARAADRPHWRRKAIEGVKEEVSFDYCFMKDETGGSSVTVIVGKDRKSGIFLGHVVPCKGASTEWIVAQLNRDLKKMGYYGLVTLKSDQEASITEVLQEVAKGRGSVRTVIESAPRGDSAGNGHAERAVRSVEESVRLQKLALESRLGARSP